MTYVDNFEQINSLASQALNSAKAAHARSLELTGNAEDDSDALEAIANEAEGAVEYFRQLEVVADNTADELDAEFSDSLV